MSFLCLPSFTGHPFSHPGIKYPVKKSPFYIPLLFLLPGFKSRHSYRWDACVCQLKKGGQALQLNSTHEQAAGIAQRNLELTIAERENGLYNRRIIFLIHTWQLHQEEAGGMQYVGTDKGYLDVL